MNNTFADTADFAAEKCGFRHSLKSMYLGTKI